MRVVAFILVSFINLSLAHAEDIQIFDMRKSLALSDQETIFRDFYLSKGLEAGLRPGMIVTVKRRQPLYDTIHNRSAGDLSVAVARIKIIHVEKNLAVARAFSDFGREDLPLLEDNYIMIGDEVDLSSATTEGKIKGQKKEKADNKATNEEQPADQSKKMPDTAAAEPSSANYSAQAQDITNKPVDGPVVQ